MVTFEGELSFMQPEGMYTQVEADDIEDAEFRMLEQLRESNPDATMIVVDNIKEIK